MVALSKTKNIQAVESLISYLNNKNKYLQDQAEISLRGIIITASIKDEYKNIPMLGEEGFLIPLLDNRLGKDQIKWHKWWEKNKDKFRQSAK